MVFTSVFLKYSFYIMQNKKVCSYTLCTKWTKNRATLCTIFRLENTLYKVLYLRQAIKRTTSKPMWGGQNWDCKKVLKRYWHKFKLVIQYIHHKKKLVIQSKKSCQTYLAVTINLNPWFWHRVFWTLKSEWWLTE